MLSRADYKDITFTVEDVLHRGRTLKKTKHRIKLGNGWMGKNYKINWVYGIWGLKGVKITIRMSKYTRRTCIGQCTIGIPGQTISLDYPIMVTYGHARCTKESMEYYIRNEYDMDRLDLEYERNEANRIGREMQIERGTEEVLWG
jgi:hypothetical protein